MSELSVMHSIARLVPPGSRVLDLGCGDGALMAHLQATRACTGYGVEIDDSKVLACIQRGVHVLQLNLEDGLAVFEDGSFDVVLQIDTLQHLRNAETMLREARFAQLEHEAAAEHHHALATMYADRVRRLEAPQLTPERRTEQPGIDAVGSEGQRSPLRVLTQPGNQAAVG